MCRGRYEPLTCRGSCLLWFPADVYVPVIDLYGQCAQVSVLNHVTRLQDNSLLCSDSQILESSQALSILLGNEIAHRSVSVALSHRHT